MEKVETMDGAYENFVTGMGTMGADKDEHTHVRIGITRPRYSELSSQYAKDGIVRRIAQMPSVKALKTPITINDDPEGETFKSLSKLGLFDAVRKAGTWSRLHGGAIVVTIYDNDGDDLSVPPRKSAKVSGYRVYSVSELQLVESSLVSDVSSDYYGKVEKWPVKLRNGRIIEIHDSRVTMFKGVQIPQETDTDIDTYLFGISEVEAANNGILKLAPTFGGISNMLQENGIGVFSLANFSSMLASQGGYDKARNRMSLIKLGMSTMRAVVQDKDDHFEMKSHSMADVPEAVKMLMAYVSSLTGMPVSILFGNMVSGLSSTNDGDIRQMNDLVEQWREDCLYVPMCKILSEYRNRNEGKAGDHDFQFGSVTQMTEKEKADLRNANVDAAQKLYNMGCFSAKEIRENILVNGGQFDLTVKSAALPKNENSNPEA